MGGRAGESLAACIDEVAHIVQGDGVCDTTHGMGINAAHLSVSNTRCPLSLCWARIFHVVLLLLVVLVVLAREFSRVHFTSPLFRQLLTLDDGSTL